MSTFSACGKGKHCAATERGTDLHGEMTFSLPKLRFYQATVFDSFIEEYFNLIYQGLQFLDFLAWQMRSAYFEEIRG